MRVKKFIENIKLKNHIKILLLLFVIVWVFSWYTFADNVSTDTDEFIDVLYKALTFLSRWRVIFANLAGKLMTNDIVYGGFLHLDNTLWTFWNVMKNFANFFLWGIVIFAILRNLLSSVVKLSDNKWWPLAIIKNTLIAGILIQMSRFLVSVVLDISTVCTVAVGSFPAQFLASNDEFKSNFSKDLEKIVRNRAIIDYSNETNPVTVQTITWDNLTQDDVNNLIDTLLPSSDSLWGPLIYIWMIVFDFNDYNIQQVQDWGSRKELLLSVGINWALLLSYSIMMVLMFMFNLMRLLILWLAIPLMPFIIVISLFGFEVKWTFAEIINIKNLLKLAFKPVILTWALSLVLVILVLIKWIINKNVNKIDMSNQNVVIESRVQDDETYNSKMSVNGLLDVNLNWFKEWFADFVVYILWLCLIYFVLKLATVKTGIKFIDDAMNGVFEKVGQLVTNLPIIPIPWWRPVSVDTLQKKLDSKTVLSQALRVDETDQSRIIDKMLKTDTTMFDSLYSTMGRAEFIQAARNIAVNNWIKTETQMRNNSYYWSALEPKIVEWNEKNRTQEMIKLEHVFEENPSSTTTASTAGASSSASASNDGSSTTSGGTGS